MLVNDLIPWDKNLGVYFHSSPSLTLIQSKQQTEINSTFIHVCIPVLVFSSNLHCYHPSLSHHQLLCALFQLSPNCSLLFLTPCYHLESTQHTELSFTIYKPGSITVVLKMLR